jgi:hypothetical protein
VGHLRVALHEAEEVGAGYGLDVGRNDGFGVDAMECTLEQGGEAEDAAGAGDAEQQETTFGGGGDELDAAAADNDDMVGGKAFLDEGYMGLIMVADAEGLEFAQSYS